MGISKPSSKFLIKLNPNKYQILFRNKYLPHEKQFIWGLNEFKSRFKL